MNRIIEVLSKERKVWSPGFWIKEYHDEEWDQLCSLEGGGFFEDSEKIVFFTSEGDTVVNLPKDGFCSWRDSNKVCYGNGGTMLIEKSLTSEGVFKITSRVEHEIVLRVEPMFDESNPQSQIFKEVRLSSYQLALMFKVRTSGLIKTAEEGQAFYESHEDDSCTLFLRDDFYNAVLFAYIGAVVRGDFDSSNARLDWYNLRRDLSGATTSKRSGIDKLKPYRV